MCKHVTSHWKSYLEFVAFNDIMDTLLYFDMFKVIISSLKFILELK